MVGEAGDEAELAERNVQGEQALASRADAQAMDVLANALANAAAKDAREMDGMHAGFERKFIERDAAAVLGLQLIQNAREPSRGVAAFAIG